MSNLGKRIEKNCEKLKISVPELAEISGIKYQTLRRIIGKDDANPTLENLRNLSISLGVSLDYLVFGEKMENDEEMGVILRDIKTLKKEDKKRIMYMVRMMIAESKDRE